MSAVAAGGLLIAAAVPVLGLNVGANSVTTLPDGFITKRAFVALQRDFPATTTDPVQIVVPRGYSEPAARTALRRLHDRLATDPRFGPGTISVTASGDAAVPAAPVQGDPAGERAVAEVRNLRSTVVPEAFAATGATALVIVAVFLGSAMGDLVMFQQMGFGVAVALLIDATIIRSVLVPATMTLLGRGNWYLPGWLHWLPELQVEGAAATRTPGAASKAR